MMIEIFEVVARVLSVLLLTSAVIFMIRYSRFRWEESIEGIGTMLSAIACVFLSIGVFLRPEGSVLTFIAVALFYVLMIFRLRSLKTAISKVKKKE